MNAWLYGSTTGTPGRDSAVNRQWATGIPPGNRSRGGDITTSPRSARRSAARREPVENDAYMAFAARIIRAAGRRIADGDVEDLPHLLQLQVELDEALQAAVDGLHDRLGFSWADIASRIGTSRQNVYKRWGRKTPDADALTAGPDRQEPKGGDQQ